MRIDPDQVIQLSENFYQAAINKAFHGNQIRVIYQATEPDKLTYLHLLDAEGADIYSHIRRSEQQRIQNIADNLLNAEKRVHLSDILKSMDEATLFQLEKDLAGEGGEALRTLFGEKVGCVKAWEVVSNLPVDKLWVRRNVDLLEKMSHLDVVDQNLVNLFYTTFKPSKFPKVPPCVVNGIQFNKYGFPDFRTSAPNMPDGSRSVFNAADHPNGFLSGAADDMTAANNWALNRYGSDNFRRIPGSTKCEIKIGDEWVEHTWHHFEDGRNMFPVPSSVHSSVQHTGGASVIDKSLEDFFDPLSF
jgi:hypothetical protein